MQDMLAKYLQFTSIKPNNWRGISSLKVGARKRVKSSRNVEYNLNTSIKS